MLKVILIFIIVFLIVRIFVLAGLESRNQNSQSQPENDNKPPKKGIPKEVGEYIEFEDMEKKS